MTISPEQITIAVTVYNRRKYIRQAVASALNQTVPVRVIVVEDCGPDPTLKSMVEEEFGSRMEYLRNPHRRGLFGNWNVCLDACGTEWLSILHDDDYLTPDFVAAMIALSQQAAGCALYYGRTMMVNEIGQPVNSSGLPRVEWEYRRVALADVLWGTPFAFPGQLMNVATTRKVGGFRESSYYCGDWEMWAKLIAAQGAAQSSTLVAYNRCHQGWERGGNVVIRSGLQLPSTCVQHKRVLALLRPQGSWKFDRKAYFAVYAVPTRFLLRYGTSLRPRLLRYHVGLMLWSKPPHFGYAVVQFLVRLGGVPFVKVLSQIWNTWDREVRPDHHLGNLKTAAGGTKANGSMTLDAGGPFRDSS
jgi:glycosyltransferase involved in cell wall biosynthesis